MTSDERRSLTRLRKRLASLCQGIRRKPRPAIPPPHTPEEQIVFPAAGARPWVYVDGRPLRPATELEEAQHARLLEYYRAEWARRKDTA
jgi:hypothetical protein